MMRALLVEDRPNDVLLLRESLDLTGMPWMLGAVPTLEAAARRWPEGLFDVLLMKLLLPHGLSLDQLDRALTPAEGQPVVVFSELEQPRLSAQLTQLGASGCVPKGLAAAEHLRRLLEPVAVRPD